MQRPATAVQANEVYLTRLMPRRAGGIGGEPGKRLSLGVTAMRSTSSRQFLYRITGYERLVETLRTDDWYFAHPSTWEDPYEVRIHNSLSPLLFAQCWCRRGVSDAMWRIYSPNNLGVRIRTQADRLKPAL